nr:hypothetical protein [Dictyobacter formicarum]
MSKDSDQRKEGKQSRGGAQDGKVRPLPLCLHAQMSADLMKSLLPFAIAAQTTPRWLGHKPADRCTEAPGNRTAPVDLE